MVIEIWGRERRTETYDLSISLLSRIASDISTVVTDACHVFLGVVESNVGRSASEEEGEEDCEELHG